MNTLRVATEAPIVEPLLPNLLVKRFQSEIGCIGECADRLEQMAAELGKSQSETTKLIAKNLRLSAALVVQVLREVETVVAIPSAPM